MVVSPNIHFKKTGCFGVPYILYIYTSYNINIYLLALLARHHLDSFHFARGDRKLKRLLCHKLHPVGGVDRKSPYSKTSKGFKAEIRHNQTLEKNRLTTNSVPAGLSKLTKKNESLPRWAPSPVASGTGV